MSINVPENQKTLKELRARYGYTQNEIADLIPMSVNNYCRLESDLNVLKKSSIRVLIRLSEIYDISKDSIFLG